MNEKFRSFRVFCGQKRSLFFLWSVNRASPFTPHISSTFAAGNFQRILIINTETTMQNLFRVVSQSEPVSINTQNGSTLQKSTVVLQEVNGKYGDSYMASLLGNQIKLYHNEYVWAALRFSVKEYNGANYQDIIIQDITSFTQH